MTVLEVTGLFHEYRQKKGLFSKEVVCVPAVIDISFRLEKGKVLGVIGASGSGKSTLARAILRLIEPTSGNIVFCGQDITRLEEKKLKPFRSRMQAVFQSPTEALNPRFTVSYILFENIFFHKIASTYNDAYLLAKELLDQVGLDEKCLAQYPHELSLGQRQRVSIARALITKPDLLILDECVSALDVSVQAQILNLLSDLQKAYGMTYLFISHDLSVVEYIADDVLVMEQGRCVEMGPAEKVCFQPEHPYTKKLFESVLAF